jgi:hypothetical protein
VSSLALLSDVCFIVCLVSVLRVVSVLCSQFVGLSSLSWFVSLAVSFQCFIVLLLYFWLRSVFILVDLFVLFCVVLAHGTSRFLHLSRYVFFALRWATETYVFSGGAYRFYVIFLEMCEDRPHLASFPSF